MNAENAMLIRRDMVHSNPKWEGKFIPGLRTSKSRLSASLVQTDFPSLFLVTSSFHFFWRLLLASGFFTWFSSVVDLSFSMEILIFRTI